MKTKLLLILCGIVFLGLSLVTSPVSANRATATPWIKVTATNTTYPSEIPVDTSTPIPTNTATLLPTNTLVPTEIPTFTPSNTPTEIIIVSVPTLTETPVIDRAITPQLAWTSTPTEEPERDKTKEPRILLPETGANKYNPFLWIGLAVVGIILLVIGFRR